jgi:hypothetical protein
MCYYLALDRIQIAATGRLLHTTFERASEVGANGSFPAVRLQHEQCDGMFQHFRPIFKGQFIALRRLRAMPKFFRKNTCAYLKNFRKVDDFFLGCGATAVFDVGNDVASYATSKQLHFGDENFPRPIFMVPKLDDVSSNVFSVAERAHWMTQNRSSH